MEEQDGTQMRYFSMFSGIGGFEHGIQQAHDNQHEPTVCEDMALTREHSLSPYACLRTTDTSPLCVGFSEIDKYATAVYQYHYKEHRNYGNATTVNTNELPDFDLLVGGFPCQTFSIAGKRKGFEDTRGTLFYEIARIAQSKRPRYMVLENVKGLLNHDKGRTFSTILRALWELGYEYQCGLVNSRYFGVPQNRERIIIVASLRGQRRPKIFPLTENSSETEERPDSWEKQTAQCQTARQYHNWHGNFVKVGTLRTHKDGEGFREMQSNISPALAARAREDGSGQTIVAIPVMTPARENKRQNGRRFKENGEPAFTLTGQDQHGVMVAGTLTGGGHSGGMHSDMDAVLEDAGIRRLTPVECERLQGFPDNWTKYGLFKNKAGELEQLEVSDTQRYKMCGNAVTTNVIQAVMEKLIAEDRK